MGRVDGKVAFITGAARGQGRSHAVRLAEEGADIIAVDRCQDFDSIQYKMASAEDLKETVRLVESHGRKIVAEQADVREPAQLKAALDRGLAELGHVDIVVSQAGIAGMKGEPQFEAWTDVLGTNMIGVLNAIHVALPHLDEGASIIATGSTAAQMISRPMMEAGKDPGGTAYMLAKQLLSHYMHELALNVAPKKIRANVIHPTNVNTAMLHADVMYQSFRPDLEHPTLDDVKPVFPVQQAMPIAWVEPVDISNAVLFLASDESRYITGQQLRVDAGGYLKWHDYHV